MQVQLLRQYAGVAGSQAPLVVDVVSLNLYRCHASSFCASWQERLT